MPAGKPCFFFLLWVSLTRLCVHQHNCSAVGGTTNHITWQRDRTRRVGSVPPHDMQCHDMQWRHIRWAAGGNMGSALCPMPRHATMTHQVDSVTCQLVSYDTPTQAAMVSCHRTSFPPLIWFCAQAPSAHTHTLSHTCAHVLLRCRQHTEQHSVGNTWHTHGMTHSATHCMTHSVTHSMGDRRHHGRRNTRRRQ